MSEVIKPSFIERDFDAIKQRMMDRSGIRDATEAQPADPEYVLLEQIAYEIYLTRCNVQDANIQNLLDYARYPMLDYLGALRNCARLTDESDDAYRERIRESMNAYTVCGTEAAYRYIGGHAHESIIDINPYSVLREVVTPDGTENLPAGIVEVYVLTKNHWSAADYEAAEDEDKAAMDEVLTAVRSALTPVSARPLGEQVSVYFPDKKEVSFSVAITAKRTAPASLQDDVAGALNDYLSGIKDGISKDVVISQVIGVCQAVPGVYKAACSLTADAEASYKEFIEATVTVDVAGVTNERE